MNKLLISALVVSIVAAVVVAVRPTEAATPYASDIYGVALNEGDVISANQSAGDPDIFIVKFKSFYGPANPGDASEAYNGFKRLFLNPAIFSMYGHLGGFSRVRQVTAEVRDSFVTSGIFRNCESGDLKVWATETTGEDDGILHHVQMSGDQAAAEDPRFFDKVFCINNREDNFYARSITPYYRLADIPRYFRRGPTPQPYCRMQGQEVPSTGDGLCCPGLTQVPVRNDVGEVVSGMSSWMCAPRDCYYRQVYCIRAPCPPILVCPTGQVSVTQPNGGETYPYAVMGPVTWTASDVQSDDRFFISLLGPGAGSGYEIANANTRMINADFTSLIQPSAVVSGYQYRMRVEQVRGYGNGNRGTTIASDESNRPFEISTWTSSCVPLPDCALPGAPAPVCAVDLMPGAVACRYPFVNWATLSQITQGSSMPWFVRVAGTMSTPCDALGVPSFSVNGTTINVHVSLVSPAATSCAQIVQEFSMNYPVSTYLPNLSWGATYTLYVNGVFRGTYQYGQ